MSHADPEVVEERLVVVRDEFARLIADARYLAGVQVLTEKIGDIQQTLQIAIAKLGLCIVVAAVTADSLTRSGDKLRMRVRCVAQVNEKVIINQGPAGTKKPALACAVAVMKAVDSKANGLDPEGQIHIAGVNEFQLVEDIPFELLKTPTDLVYEINATTEVEL